jgi:hypothetical protein
VISQPQVYNIRTFPPSRIRHNALENKLFNQWQSFDHAGIFPPPYNHYLVYTAFFEKPDASRLHFTNVDFFDYTFERNDCLINFYLPGDTLQAELINGGEEITFERYAIYDHRISGSGHDTFSFIEFRNREFKSYEEIIFEFARDHFGQYDTVGIELVSSRTKE